MLTASANDEMNQKRGSARRGNWVTERGAIRPSTASAPASPPPHPQKEGARAERVRRTENCHTRNDSSCLTRFQNRRKVKGKEQENWRLREAVPGAESRDRRRRTRRGTRNHDWRGTRRRRRWCPVGDAFRACKTDQYEGKLSKILKNGGKQSKLEHRREVVSIVQSLWQPFQEQLPHSQRIRWFDKKRK
jgi:hypothetical protein